MSERKQEQAEVVKTGRPSKYDPTFCEIAYQLYTGGATDAEVAKVLDVNPATLYRWVAEHEEFRNTQKLGKVSADERVERSLYHRATGYSHPAVKIFCDPKTGKHSLIEYVEHYPPDTTACIFWLKNRRPETWKDKHEIAITDSAQSGEQAIQTWLRTTAKQQGLNDPLPATPDNIRLACEQLRAGAEYLEGQNRADLLAFLDEKERGLLGSEAIR
jgi:transposase-like protein